MSKRIFISIDVNDTGKKLERYILLGDLKGLTEFSARISDIIGKLSDLITSNNGNVIMAGGDNILADIPIEKCNEIVQATNKAQSGEEIRIAVGVGDSATDSYLAIKYAKASKKTAVQYTNNIFKEIVEEN